MRTALLFLIIGLTVCTFCKAQDIPVLPQEKFRHHEFSVSYGFLPITDANSMAEECFAPVLSFGVYTREKTNYYGALSISYIYRFNRKISLGVTGGITGNKGTASSLYEALDTSAGLGAYFLRNSFGGEVFHKTKFAYQFSFLGIEYGSRFAFFTEFGVGYTGTIVAGGRYRF